ncbi:antirestriction protein ArdA [Thermoactinomyces sp. DSM 45892]|uniref:antirestriction protein ArdA n=1 Tax=Thermoactinomyces sp. DSM 45892 TaxID=1882753 RepID=UPI0008945324|nr:antirestriction protein ArdA [Thermoactinomyces sp. DSM 45892]SDZ06403.1 Antirestriction protein [Thermoactinomyces sp. DSM 45892]
MDTEIRILIRNLGKYNEGELVGEWIDLPYTEEELHNLFVNIGLGYFDESGKYHHGVYKNGVCYEEYAIHDYEAPFNIHEYECLSELNEVAEKLDMLEEKEKKAIITLENDVGLSWDDAFKEVHEGNYRLWHEDTMGDIAYAFYEDSGSIDDNHPLTMYIDWDSVGRDMKINGTFIQMESGLWLEYYN